MTEKLSIQYEMQQFDQKVRSFYENLTEEERKKFSTYLMIRWGSSVQGSRELQEFYVIATNERFNKHFFNLSKHPKLQWLLATTVSPGLGTYKHQWIPLRKKEAGAGSTKKQLAELFPHYKDDEIELLASITSKKELDAYIKLHGREK